MRVRTGTTADSALTVARSADAEQGKAEGGSRSTSGLPAKRSAHQQRPRPTKGEAAAKPARKAADAARACVVEKTSR